jgi:hypothetical protein
VKQWTEHPKAREEFLAEVDRLPVDIAEDFIERTEKSVLDILSQPHGWPKVHYWVEPPTVRWRAIKPFRIRIVYYYHESEVRVIAYAHEARKPGYWRDRLT